MNQDELNQLNDKILEQDERHWLEPDDDEDQESIWDSEAANIAEDEFMDERDGF